jgi:hypothetical protein
MRWIVALAVAVAVMSPAAARAGRPAFFELDYPPRADTFVIKLTDPAKIEHARRILSGEETAAVHVMGKVRRRSARWNEPWSYILRPHTVEFFEVAIEVCDAGIAYVEEHLDEVGGAFLPGKVWCPWGSRLLRELEP